MKLLAWLLLSSIATAAYTDVYLVAGDDNAIGYMGLEGVPGDVNESDVRVKYGFYVNRPGYVRSGDLTLGTVGDTGGVELAMGMRLKNAGGSVAIAKVGYANPEAWTNGTGRNKILEVVYTLFASIGKTGRAPRLVGVAIIHDDSDALVAALREDFYADLKIVVAGESGLIPVTGRLTSEMQGAIGFQMADYFLAPDYDRNGTVDGADFLRWQRSPMPETLARWKAAYGGATIGTAIPEPTSLWWTLLLLVRRK